MNVQVLGIAASSPFSQRTFAESLELSYPLLSDFPEPRVIRSYGVLRPYPKDPKRMVARRSFFLIDSGGIVRGKWLAEDDVVFLNEPILEAVRELPSNQRAIRSDSP